VAVISHSGGLLNEVTSYGPPRGIGFSHVVSAGNEAGVTAADLIDYFVEDPATDVVLAILEMVRDPALFVAASARALAARKPIIVLKMGWSEKGARSAFTHTGAVAGDDAVYSALFRQLGILRVNDIDELVDMGALLDEVYREGQLLSGGSHTLRLEVASDAKLLGNREELRGRREDRGGRREGVVDRRRGPRGHRRDNDNNPPGRKGGPGTNWENSPGPKGGPGASPGRRRGCRSSRGGRNEAPRRT
jgi:hypothetical protein